MRIDRAFAGPAGGQAAEATEMARKKAPSCRPSRRTRSASASRCRRGCARRSATPRAPLFRPLRIYTLDPSVSDRLGGVATVQVPYEKLEAGPVGVAVPDPLRRRAGGRCVADRARSRRAAPAAVERTCRRRRRTAASTCRWSTPSAASPTPRSSARSAARSPGRFRPRPTARSRLVVRPFVPGANAGYSREAGDLSFGYFKAGRAGRRGSPCRTA